MLSIVVKALRAPLTGHEPKNAGHATTPLHIPLAASYLCQDCNCVSNQSRQCPACASQVLLGLAGILNREDAPATTPVQSYSYVTSLVA